MAGVIPAIFVYIPAKTEGLRQENRRAGNMGEGTGEQERERGQENRSPAISSASL